MLQSIVSLRVGHNLETEQQVRHRVAKGKAIKSPTEIIPIFL